MFQKIKSWFQKPREPTQQEKTTKLIRKLKNLDYGFVYSSDLALVRLNLVKKNISDYISYLRKINRMLSGNDEIYPNSISSIRYQIQLPDWFIVKGGFINPNEQMVLFLEEIESFMDIYNKLDNNHARTYNQDHNLKIVGNICGDLLLFMKDIENVWNQSLQSGSQ